MASEHVFTLHRSSNSFSLYSISADRSLFVCLPVHFISSSFRFELIFFISFTSIFHIHPYPRAQIQQTTPSVQHVYGAIPLYSPPTALYSPPHPRNPAYACLPPYYCVYIDLYIRTAVALEPKCIIQVMLYVLYEVHDA